MNAAGSLGFFPELRGLKDLGVLDQFGAFVTNPFSLRPRLPTSQPAVIEYPGGFLLHTGLPNPGLSAGIRKYASKWDKSDLPVIVHLMADRPEETRSMVRMLEEIENVMAVELGFAPLLADDIILLTLEMCLGELPLIFSLPVEQVLSLGPKLVQAGAEAVSIGSPRGSQVSRSKSVVSGQVVWSIPVPAGIRRCPQCRQTGTSPSSARAGCGQKKTPTRCSRSARWRCRWMRRCGIQCLLFWLQQHDRDVSVGGLFLILLISCVIRDRQLPIVVVIVPFEFTGNIFP